MIDTGVVMPVYTQKPAYLKKALRSLLNQSYPHFEFVIVIDGASQETCNIIKEETQKDNRVQIIHKKKNQGVAKALNSGFERLMNKPHIKYLTWVSSDNIYYPVFIEKLRTALAQSPDGVGLVYSSFRHVDHLGHPRPDINLAQFRKYQENPKEKILDFCFIGASFMYEKEFACRIDGYRAEPVEDYEYWLRLTELCDVRYVPVELMDYRENASHSVSAQLKSSVEQHRRWRFANQLIKHQARMRRNIRVETTVVFLIRDNKENIANLEKVLNQLYESYKLILIDTSNKQIAAHILTTVKDPRITLLTLPNVEPETALKRGIKYADTLFVIFYGNSYYPPTSETLTQLVAMHKNHSQETVSTYLEGTKLKLRRLPVSEEPVFGQLYKANYRFVWP